MTQALDTIEAVIISGPRRGEIVQLSEEAIPGASEDNIRTLNEFLDELIAAIDRVAGEVRDTTAALREKPEAT